MRDGSICLDVEAQGSLVRVELGGALSLASAYPIITRIRSSQRQDSQRLVIDLRGVENISPGGFEAIERVRAAMVGVFESVLILVAQGLPHNS